MENLVNISIDGKSFQVPDGISAVQALWHCGMDPRHGIGCLGGVCGACTMTWKTGSVPFRTGLGCQTPVCEGMEIRFMETDFPRYVPYQTRPWETVKRGELNETSLRNHFLETLPTTRRCVACGACTAVCPQNIDVMKGVKETLNGNFREVSDLFLNCVMCGFCALVCETKVYPHLAGLYGRRMKGIFLDPESLALSERIRQIDSGFYDEEWLRLLAAPVQEEVGDPA